MKLCYGSQFYMSSNQFRRQRGVKLQACYNLRTDTTVSKDRRKIFEGDEDARNRTSASVNDKHLKLSQRGTVKLLRVETELK